MGAVPETISHYKLIAPLGRGGMGEVYRAVDQRLKREVALKLLAGVRGDAELHQRFLREARAASALNHPGIVTLHDVGEWQGRLYLVMELVGGEPFSELAARGVSPADALALCAEAADALAAAHANGILHRDIKSDNLMRAKDGRVKVLDFGIAKLESRSRASVPLLPQPLKSALPGDSDPTQQPATGTVVGDDSGDPAVTLLTMQVATRGDARRAANPDDLTIAGTLLGTPAYMAPERAAGEPCDARSDVFSLGVVLYELLVGTRPFKGATIGETLTAVRAAVVERPSVVAPVPAAVDDVVLRALAPDRNERIPDMATFAKQMRETASALAAKPRDRRPRWLAAAVAAGVVVGGAAIGLVALDRRASPAASHVSATRRITFEPMCDEFPALMADGHTVIFDTIVDGDSELVSLDLDSGQRRRLTHSPSWDYAPALSADGRWIAYVHSDPNGDQVRIIPSDGDASGARTLGPIDGYPTWSRDGGVLAGTPHSEIVRYDIDNGGPRIVATLPDGRLARHIASDASGHFWVLWHRPGSREQEGGLAEISADGTFREVESHLLSTHFGLALSPHGNLYYVKPTLADRTELMRVASGGAPASVPGVAPYAGLTISRRGNRLVYSTCDAFASLVQIGRGGETTQLGIKGRWRDRAPVRVDAHHLLFTSDRSGTDQLWVADTTTGEQRPFGKTNTMQASVSPDGTAVVYVDRDRGGLVYAPIVGGTAGPARQLTTNASDALPAFTHDGKHVVFERVTGAAPRVFVLALDGRDARPITPAGSELLAVSPAADELAFTTGRIVMITDLRGQHAHPLSSSLDARVYTHARYSPDGTRILLVKNEQELLELPSNGSAPPTLRFDAGLGAIDDIDYAADGVTVLASIINWDGDLWLADGYFP